MARDPDPGAIPTSRLIAGRVTVLVVLGLVAALIFVFARMLLIRPETGREVGVDSPLAQQCPGVEEAVLAGAERLRLTGAGGTALGGALIGPADATHGVVVRQGAAQTICNWLPWAAATAAETGARVLLFDRRGRGSSPAEPNVALEPEDTALAVATLREAGVERVALVASSMGNAVAYAALPLIDPAPCAVVSISPVLTASDDAGSARGDALESLADTTWLTWETQDRGIAANVDAIRAALQAQGRAAPRELPVDTGDHSMALLENHADVAAFVRDAASCA